MKNIIDLTTELIQANGPVSTKEIADQIENETLKSYSASELNTVIFNDLQIDGTFIFVNDKWDLKVKYTMKDVIREQYKNIGHASIIEEEDDDLGLNFEDEPELIISSDEDEDEVNTGANILDEFEEI